MEGDSADPYFKLYVDDNKIYESDKIKNTLNPNWDEFSIDREEFGGNPKITDIKMRVKDDDWGNADDDIGKCFFKIRNHEGRRGARQGIDLVNDDGDTVGEVFIEVD